MDFKQLGAMFGGGISGIGAGMMSNKFRQSFNAGQGGMWDLYRGQQMDDGMRELAGRAEMNKRTKRGQDLLTDPQIELLDRGIDATKYR